jgi:hypothetical protein
MLTQDLQEPEAVEELVSQRLDTLAALDAAAPSVTAWLKEALLIAHQSDAVKTRIAQLLGTFFYTGSLDYLDSWKGLKSHCQTVALDMSVEMRNFFEEGQLHAVLGESVRNFRGQADHSRTLRRYTVRPCKSMPLPCEPGLCPTPSFRPRQDEASDKFPRDATMSQTTNEKVYAHVLRMVAMGLDERFHDACQDTCSRYNGDLKASAIKEHHKIMSNSQNEHFSAPYPRPSQSIDVLSNTASFENPQDLMACIQDMRDHSAFTENPISITNQFSHSDELAASQFHYRAIVVNWLFSPGITYAQLAVEVENLWERYNNHAHVPGYGNQDPRESWHTWRSHIALATAYLRSKKMRNQQVQFITETQFTLRPFLEGRKKGHMLHRIWNADTPDALYRECVPAKAEETSSYDRLQNSSLAALQARMATGRYDVNLSSQLFHSSFAGYERVVEVLLTISDIEVNRARSSDGATPLYMAVDQGHAPVVQMLVDHPQIDVNRAQLDVGFTPLYAAADKGRDCIVEILLSKDSIDVNQARTDLGITPLLIAASLGHERTVELLLAHVDIDINKSKTDDGTTPLHWAFANGHSGVVKMLVAHGATERRFDTHKARLAEDTPTHKPRGTK